MKRCVAIDIRTNKLWHDEDGFNDNTASVKSSYQWAMFLRWRTAPWLDDKDRRDEEQVNSLRLMNLDNAIFFGVKPERLT